MRCYEISARRPLSRCGDGLEKAHASRIEILPDDVTPELAAVVQRISGLPMHERRKQSKDLGETMVIAHAVVAAESGQPVTILMDDRPGAVIATSESADCNDLVTSGRQVGSITLASTLTVLGRAAGTEHNASALRRNG